MVRPVIKDPVFLSQRSVPATREDSGIAEDLLDTLAAHRAGCVGMAANMIGKAKRIIVFDNGGQYMTMYNPEIVSRTDPYPAEEGCLSLTGTRKTIRFKIITVRYRDGRFRLREESFSGWTAQIIQHEIDHCDGILI